MPKLIRRKIYSDLKKIKSKKKFSNLNFKKIPNIMGVLNLTPDSFSDGGKFNSKKEFNHAISLLNCGANLIDIGGESTRPGSKVIRENLEWQRIEKILKSLIKKKIPISLDTESLKL